MKLNYKGYVGKIEIQDSGQLFGQVLDIHDVVTFRGESLAEATQAFRDSIEDYLEFCREFPIKKSNLMDRG